jgi:hypothetical protein
MTSTIAHDEQALLARVLGSQINIPPQPSILLETDPLVNQHGNNPERFIFTRTGMRPLAGKFPLPALVQHIVQHTH